MDESRNQQDPSKFSDLQEFLKVLRKRKKVIAWATVICAFLTLFISFFIVTPKYSSSTDILVNRKMNANQAVNAPQAQIQADVQMISTYKDIITSPTILDSVSKKMASDGYQTSAGQLKKEISISNQQNSQVFTVTVKTNNPALAADAANTIANVFKDKVIKIMNVNNVTILSKAVENPRPVSPKALVNTVLGALCGIILGIVLAFVFDGLDRTISDETFITEELGLNELGIISEIPASKVKKLISTGHIASRGSGKRRV